MSDNPKQVHDDYARCLLGAQVFFAALVNTTSLQDFAHVANERFQEIDMADFFFGYSLPVQCALLSRALALSNGTPDDFHQIYSAQGEQLTGMMARPVKWLSEIMGRSEEDMTAMLTRAGFIVEQGLVTHHVLKPEDHRQLILDIHAPKKGPKQG